MALERKINFQSLAWFWDLSNRKLLDLDPPYQRRSVWNQEYRDFFIDTVLLGYPAPAIFLYEEITASGVLSYAVVDGKQRLTTLFDFASNVFPVSSSAEISSIRGLYFKDLDDDRKKQFWKYPFAVEYLPSSDEKLINGIFDRINRNVSKLSRQELRHARFSGIFISSAESLTDEMLELFPKGFPQLANKSRAQMKDVEFVAQLLLLIDEGVKSYSQDELDAAFSQRDEAWEKRTEVVAKFGTVINEMNKVVRVEEGIPTQLFRTRLRNQADFYSFFGGILSLVESGSVINSKLVAEKISVFLGQVDSPEGRAASTTAAEYFDAARSASNDIGPRLKRIQIMKSVIV